MTITSYAQNFEDVILWRALKDVQEGTYIDIGAQDPMLDSVSRAFYERGWRGVHVEPVKLYCDLLRANRQDEEVIEAAITTNDDSISFYEIPGTGLNTGDEIIAAEHASHGWQVKNTTVRTMSLGNLLDRYGGRDIHWLKIDVEGMEADVIASWGESPVRPWVLVIESTRPGSPEQTHQDWDGKVRSFGYEFVYFDGLNRFYVSDAKPDLVDAFGPGPHVFDDFLLSIDTPFCKQARDALTASATEHAAAAAKTATEMRRLRNVAATLEDRLARSKNQLVFSAKELAAKDERIWKLASSLQASEHELTSNKARLSELVLALHAMKQSTSWRLTAPMRLYKRFTITLRQGTSAWLRLKPGSFPRRFAGMALRRIADVVRGRPRLKRAVIAVSGVAPRLQARLFRFAVQPSRFEHGQVMIGSDPESFHLEADPAQLAEWRTLLLLKGA